jgi:hypothetical protein
MRILRAAALALSFCGAVILGPGPARGAAAPDPCAEARRVDGWCEREGLGYVANVAIRSRLLYDALDAHGHVLDLSTFTCPTCKEAIATGGFCEEHRTGFVKKQAYFSRLTYEMARGERVDPARLRCPDCRRNAETTGWCAKHRTGMIGNVAIRDRAAWERADAAVRILRAAVEMLPRCEWCAIAMVTDTKCPIDKTQWRGGQPVR